MNRRKFLCHCVAGSLFAGIARAAPVPRRTDFDHGLVAPPAPVPAVTMQCSDGRMRDLRELLLGKTTAVNLVFVGCSSVCPIQASIFQRLQKLLPKQTERGIQLLSLSIDPQNDGADQLEHWLRRHHAGPGWLAAVPEAHRLPDVLASFGQGQGRIESHATQVSIVNRRAELVWRTGSLPPAEELAGLLRSV